MNAVEEALWGYAPERIREAIRKIAYSVAEEALLPEIANDWARILWLEATGYAPQGPSEEFPDAHRVINPLPARIRSIALERMTLLSQLRREASKMAAGAMLRGKPVQATQDALNEVCEAHGLREGFFDPELSEEVAWYLRGFAQQEALLGGGHAR